MTTATLLTRSTLAQRYHADGFFCMHGVFAEQEVREIQAECRRLFACFGQGGDEYNLRLQFRNHQSGKPVLDRMDPVRDISPLLDTLSRDERILSAVEEALGEPGILFKDKMILKGPGTHGYGVHQDYTNWQEIPAPAAALLSLLLAVDDSSEDKGGLELFPGLHHTHYRERETPSSIFDPQAGLVPPEAIAGHSPAAPELRAGDIILFHSLTPHQSGINRSDSTRSTIYFSYSAASYGDLYETYYRNFYGYLRKDRSAEGDRLHYR